MGIGTGVWVFTGSPLALPAAVGAGVLIDADHALDYYNWYVRRDTRFLFLPLHALELSVVLLALLAVW